MNNAKTILLLRHAKSSWDTPQQIDHDRPLNRRGERAAKTMADHIATHSLRPGVILCSTATRTRQTMAPVVKALGDPTPQIEFESDLYLASEEALLERLQALADDTSTVLLIGHNDGIGQLANALAGHGLPPALERLREKYPTAALATLRLSSGSWSSLAPGACELLAFVRPRDFDPR